jgi:hypothetical protein
LVVVETPTQLTPEQDADVRAAYARNSGEPAKDAPIRGI